MCIVFLNSGHPKLVKVHVLGCICEYGFGWLYKRISLITKCLLKTRKRYHVTDRSSLQEGNNAKHQIRICINKEYNRKIMALSTSYAENLI